MYKFTFLLVSALLIVLSGKAQNTPTSLNSVLSTTKDSVTTGTKEEQPEYTSVIHGVDHSSVLPFDEHIYAMVTQMPQ